MIDPTTASHYWYTHELLTCLTHLRQTKGTTRASWCTVLSGTTATSSTMSGSDPAAPTTLITSSTRVSKCFCMCVCIHHPSPLPHVDSCRSICIPERHVECARLLLDHQPLRPAPVDIYRHFLHPLTRSLYICAQISLEHQPSPLLDALQRHRRLPVRRIQVAAHLPGLHSRNRGRCINSHTRTHTDTHTPPPAHAACDDLPLTSAQHLRTQQSMSNLNFFLNGQLHGPVHIMVGGHWGLSPKLRRSAQQSTLQTGTDTFLLLAK